MISVAVTTFQRTSLLFEALANVIDDQRVTEIVIVDDHSDLNIYNQLEIYARSYGKIKLFRNDKNVDCYLNKRLSVFGCSGEWVCMWDSDNKFDKGYVDRIENLFIGGLQEKTIYQPEFAEPHFNFEKYSGLLISKANVAQYMADATFQTMLNASNFFVNRAEYLRLFDASVDPVTSDSIFTAYNWLKAGNSIYVVPGLKYYHRVNNHGKEEGSHFTKNFRRTKRDFHEGIIKKLKHMV